MGRVFIQTFEHSNIQTFLNSQLHHSQLHHYLLCLFTFKKKYLPPCAVCGIYDILRITFTEHGVVAQLVSALDCRSGGCGFEPRRPRQYGRSNEIASWCNGSTADSDSACWGSSPCEATIFFLRQLFSNSEMSEFLFVITLFSGICESFGRTRSVNTAIAVLTDLGI